MFNRKGDSGAKPSEDSGRSRPEVFPSSVSVGNGEKAVIGKSIVIKGEVSGQEDLVVEGTIEGQIVLENQHVTIGSSGRVLAEVKARLVTIEGEVVGNIQARERGHHHGQGEPHRRHPGGQAEDRRRSLPQGDGLSDPPGKGEGHSAEPFQPPGQKNPRSGGSGRIKMAKAAFREEEAFTHGANSLGLFVDRLQKFQNPVVLDLGPVCEQNLNFLAGDNRFAVRVEDLGREAEGNLARAVEELVLGKEKFHGVLIWSLLDYLERDIFRSLVIKLWSALIPGGLVAALLRPEAFAGSRHSAVHYPGERDGLHAGYRDQGSLPELAQQRDPATVRAF